MVLAILGGVIFARILPLPWSLIAAIAWGWNAPKIINLFLKDDYE